MNNTPERLVDDLLAETAPPEFRAALLEKTLQSARRRKRQRQLGLSLGTALFAGIFASVFFEMRPPKTAPIPTPRPELHVVDSSSAYPVQVISTALDSALSLTIVQSSESERPEEINDRQLLALLSDRSVALVHPDNGQAQLMVWNPQTGQMLPTR